MSTPAPSPTPETTPTSVPASPPSTPTPTPPPSPGPAPTPPAVDIQVAMPNVPPNTYDLLVSLANDIDGANGKLNTHSSRLSDIMGKAGGAVSNVSSTSQGKATDALNTTWHYTQTDLNSSYEPLTAITAGGYMGGSGGATNPLWAALDEHGSAIQNGLVAMENINSVLNTCLAHPPTQATVEGWVQQVNALTGALGNINIAIDMMAMAIRGLNGGFTASCATGFTPGGPIPSFTQHSFDNQMSRSSSSSGGSSSGRTGYSDLTHRLTTAGVSSKKITNIINALKEGGMSDADITSFMQELEDSGLSQNQIVKFFTNSKYAAQMPEIWSLYQKAQGVPNIDRVLRDMANGSSTNFSGSLYQLQYISKYVDEHPNGPTISDVEPMIGGQKGPDIVLDNNTVIDLKTYDWSKLDNMNYIKTTFGNGITMEQGIANQIQRYKDLYGGANIVYVADSKYGTIPASVMEIFTREGVKVEYWP